MNILPVPALYSSIIAKEVMKYKEQIKETELVTKIRIVRAARRDHIPVTQVAEAFSCHRNTVRNILKTFAKKVPIEDQSLLLSSGGSFSHEELLRLFGQVQNGKRTPHGHKRAASDSQEQEILQLFQTEKIRVGVKRMRTFLRRRYEKEHPLVVLTSGQLKGIYRKHNLRVQKVRSSNGERRSLYDYRSLACFERLHYDVKHILDKHALPEEIYQILSGRDIPKYEWNIIDAKSRFRFIAYSYEISAEFGLHFLLFVTQYLRAVLHNLEQPIVIGFDNGSEFCSGSPRKETEWNELLSCMNAGVYAYEPSFDIRKNLIERSHLTDDEELYIPRGIFMNTKKSFLKEVTDYSFYWNYQRPHSGIGMDDRTPYEVVKQSGLMGAERLLSFPTLILDDVINELKVCTKSILVDAYAQKHPDKMKKVSSDPKLKRDLELKFFLPSDAQNVLTHYRN
jgi:putative transposase